MVHLPSKGAGETLPALLRGDIHITESNVASNIGAVRAGQVRAYAVTSGERLPELPEVPTMADAGFPGIGRLNRNGIFAPAKTPNPIVDKLFAAIVASMKDADMQPLLQKRLIPVSLSESPAQFDRYVRSESARWDKIVKSNSVHID